MSLSEPKARTVFFKCFDLMVYAHQVVDIVVSLQQTLFFVGRNFEKFLLSCGCQGDGLPFQIDTDGGRRI